MSFAGMSAKTILVHALIAVAAVSLAKRVPAINNVAKL
jgi:hypothetical protein